VFSVICNILMSFVTVYFTSFLILAVLILLASVFFLCSSHEYCCGVLLTTICKNVLLFDVFVCMLFSFCTYVPIGTYVPM
jgi:hypothetical protein